MKLSTALQYVVWVYLVIAFQYQSPETQRLNISPAITGLYVSCFQAPNSVLIWH